MGSKYTFSWHTPNNQYTATRLHPPKVSTASNLSIKLQGNKRVNPSKRSEPSHYNHLIKTPGTPRRSVEKKKKRKVDNFHRVDSRPPGSLEAKGQGRQSQSQAEDGLKSTGACRELLRISGLEGQLCSLLAA